MKYIKKIVGSKCYLSPIFLEDVETITGWFNDLVVTKYLTTVIKPLSLLKEKEILESMVKQEHIYGIIDAELNKIIGVTGLHSVDTSNGTADLGIVIGEKDYWNKGYGEEATRLILDFGFNILNLHNIVLHLIDYNRRAYRCYEKIGFKEIGRRRESFRIAGKYCDMVLMDILSEEFEGSVLLKYFSEEFEENLKSRKIELVL